MKNQSSRTLTLRIVRPDHPVITAECDSVRLTLADDENGRGGGSYGVRYGHAKAVLLLGKGALSAYSGGELVMSAECSDGFARVEDNIVTVVTEKCEKKPLK